MVNLSLEFKYYKINDIGEVVSGGTPSTSKNEYWYGDIGWITPKDLSSYDDIYISRGERNISSEGLNNSSAKLVPKNTVLMTSRAPIGYIAIANNELSTNQGFKSLICNEKICHYKYFYYWLKLNIKYIINNSNGSTFKEISGGTFKNLELSLPSLNEQKAISSVLWTIDEKISVLKRINKNLEELIKHIYINWFEDFEPFKGNTFHDTKLGKIPNGWNVKPLHKFIKFQEGPGIRNWQYVEEDGINFLNIRCIQNNDLILNTANMISKEEANGKYAHFMLNEWDLVISSSGTLGRYAIVRKEHLPLCLNTSIIRFKPLHSINHYAYIYSYLTSRGFYHYLLTMGSGSVQLNFGPTHLKQIDLIVPPEDVLKRYNETVFPIIEKIVKIKAEINKLTKLRDTLLPKLMSGEIDVSKINCDLELKYNYMKYLFNQIHTPMSKSVV